MKMEQSVPKRRHIKFRRRGITQKKAYNMFLLVSVAEWMMWLKEFCRKISASFDKQCLAIAFGNVRFTAGSSSPPPAPPRIICSLVRNLLVNINRPSFQELKAKRRSALHDCLFVYTALLWVVLTYREFLKSVVINNKLLQLQYEWARVRQIV